VLSGLSVLVVDDHGTSLERVVKCFNPVGAIAIGVRSVKAAISYAAAARFDAVVADVNMEDGAWLLHQLLESHTASTETRVFAISGERHDQHHRQHFARYFFEAAQPRHARTRARRFAAQTRATALMPAETRSLGGLTILVVDDHADTVEMFTECLTACGATVASARSAKSGLAITEALVLDAVLIDLRMPGEDGHWFLRQLCASATASANAAVFAVSGERHDQPDASSGFAGYFLKPVNLYVIVAALAALPRRG
jgi:CheY-like chemotaxis protein